ncbi:DUF397 domain-containing protein [Streptomyces sp. NBC_00988]|uniref:DUF397 domain-containing protein n=1 Tax=Streptomyces sp. NBC_00988 TaxID=2903704 RepID=UPI0038663CB9|nr:DUF397 domain-containing protein [Streptomyces sp. NBC_00988]
MRAPRRHRRGGRAGWRKSSYSEGGANDCVEVADGRPGVPSAVGTDPGVRRTGHLSRPVLCPAASRVHGHVDSPDNPGRGLPAGILGFH